MSTKQNFVTMKSCNLFFKQLKEDIIDHLNFKFIKFFSNGELNICKKNFKKLNKNNLMYFKTIKEEHIHAFQKVKLAIWILYAKEIYQPQELISICKA